MFSIAFLTGSVNKVVHYTVVYGSVYDVGSYKNNGKTGTRLRPGGGYL